MQHIPAARAEINEEKIVRLARRLIGARARKGGRRGGEAAAAGSPAAPGAQRGDGSGGVPRGPRGAARTGQRPAAAVRTGSRRRRPRGPSGEGLAVGIGEGYVGGLCAVPPQLGVASADLCGVGMT